MSSDIIIRDRLAGVYFSYYSKQEIRKLSVKEINNINAFDQINRPLKGGLYDPAMGVSPYDRHTRCVTCGQEGMNCPGHIGHIELILPVYNPFLMDILLKLLKSSCSRCHKLRIPEKKKETYRVMLLLIKLGYINESYTFEYASSFKYEENQKINTNDIFEDDTMYESESSAFGSRRDTNSKTTSRKASETTDGERGFSENTSTTQTKRKKTAPSSANEDQDKHILEKLKSQLSQICKTRKAEIEQLLNIKSRSEEFKNFNVKTSAMNIVLRDVINDFWHCVVQQKCPFCPKKQDAIKKEGYSKLFIIKKQEDEKNWDKDSEQETDQEATAQKGKGKEKKKQHFLNPMQVRAQLKQLWSNEKEILDLIFGNLIINKKTMENTPMGYHIISNGYQMFFLDVIPVSPNRFRPENKLSDQTFLHGHTVILSKIITLNIEIRNLILGREKTVDVSTPTSKTGVTEIQADDLNLESLRTELQKDLQKQIKKGGELTNTITKWIELQDTTNSLFDASKASKTSEKDGTGIKQLLEKKEGLFRMKMMGKRVNFAARSVISPDPYIDTNEVGVPLFMAKRLTFPEGVNEHNLKQLRKMIINGPFEYPGANSIEDNGVRIALEHRNEQQRVALAKTLLTDCSKKVVYRHLQTGDVLLFNRQPTLHKPSIMSHIARVLPKEQTIRMHYANCNSYNADFDGDEMNLHFVQNHITRSEAYLLSLTDKQYVVPKDGRPIRGLIQDSIVSGVFLTCKNTFLKRDEYQQLVYIATWNLLSGGKTVKVPIVNPTIWKPVPLWTGKQVITTILNIIASYNRDEKGTVIGLNMTGKTKLNSSSFGPNAQEEGSVLIVDNELLQGVLDKNQVGNSEYGLIHSFYELYGATLTGKLLTSLSRLFTAFLQMHGFTCGVDDLFLNELNEEKRKDMIEEAHRQAIRHAGYFCGLENYEIKESWKLSNRPSYRCNKYGEYKSRVMEREPEIDYISSSNVILSSLKKKILTEKSAIDNLDREMKGVLGQHTSEILKLSSTGLQKNFPQNLFSTMVQSGAKGSGLNHSLVSIMLGQQELEGKRVPIMPSGKSLPCFLPYDPNPRAGGYVTDRYLTGLRPQEFFFHCMAGREGLIDTAVKTSRSGYLQRCLVKHLESLIVNYDYTVRDSDGSIVQFMYGEDSVDPVKRQYLGKDKFEFLAKNFKGYSIKYNPRILAGGALKKKEVTNYLKQRKANKELYKHDTILNNFFPGSYLGAISEKAYYEINDFIANERKKSPGLSIFKDHLTDKKFFTLFNIKYFNSLISPGEAVGAIAAQSIGEPSTQMTLNTFHLAGHGGANVTLGVPRLREILMTATDQIKTPSMLLRFADKSISKEMAELYARKLQRVNLLELVQSVKVKEIKKLIGKDNKPLAYEKRARLYKIYILFEDMEAIDYAFELKEKIIKQKLEKKFIPLFLSHVTKQLKKTHGNTLNITTRMVKSGGDLEREDGENDDGEKDEAEDEAVPPQEEQENILYQDIDDKIKKIEEEDSQPFPKSDKKKGGEADDLENSPYYKNLKKFSFKNGLCKLSIEVPLDSNKLLMINLVETSLLGSLVYEVKNISKSHLVKKDVGSTKEYQIETEGVNYKACWNYPFIDHNRIESNDIQAIVKTYGIEAGARGIIQELVRVFSVYSITVDYRHLYLIADYMSFSGRIKAMNRTGMQDSTSPFLKMSFETTMNFLTHATINNEYEDMKTPSAQIVLGRVPRVGTGMFDILHKIK